MKIRCHIHKWANDLRQGRWGAGTHGDEHTKRGRKRKSRRKNRRKDRMKLRQGGFDE